MPAPEGYCSVYQAQRMLGVSKARIYALVRDGRLTKVKDGERSWIALEDVERERDKKDGQLVPKTHSEKLKEIEKERRRQEQKSEREQRDREKLDAERAEQQRSLYRDVDEAKFRATVSNELHATRLALETIASQLSWLVAGLGIVALRAGVDIAAELKRKP